MNTERLKKMPKIKIIFMGTPDFAVPVLKVLHEKYDVVLAVTRADKPKGRGKKMSVTPVKETAEALGIPVVTPESVKTPEFTELLRSYNADIFVTCAYGKILPQSVIDVPPMGIVNVHASLLPKYRGAAPIWRVILNGETETGVTTMLTDIGMDTGKILLSEKIEIGHEMTTGELHDKLSEIGASLIVKTIDGLADGSITPVAQDDSLACYSPMVSRADGAIDWNCGAETVHNKVRGCNPFPGAFAELNGEKIKIIKTVTGKICDENCVPGTVTNSAPDGIDVCCGDGKILTIKEIQGNSSRAMSVRDYLNGHKIQKGEIFGNGDKGEN